MIAVQSHGAALYYALTVTLVMIAVYVAMLSLRFFGWGRSTRKEILLLNLLRKLLGQRKLTRKPSSPWFLCPHFEAFVGTVCLLMIKQLQCRVAHPCIFFVPTLPFPWTQYHPTKELGTIINTVVKFQYKICRSSAEGEREGGSQHSGRRYYILTGQNNSKSNTQIIKNSLNLGFLLLFGSETWPSSSPFAEDEVWIWGSG